MDILNKLKEHLKSYRDKNNLTKAQMAAFIEVSERNYNDIEVKGEIKKVAVLLTIIEKTGFSPMQKNAEAPPGERERELSDKLISKLEKEIERLIDENKTLKKDQPLKNLGKVGKL